MATWNRAVLTNMGRQLQRRVEAGEELVFTRMAMGSGKPSKLETATDLSERKIDMTIASIDTSHPYTVTVYGILSNAKLSEGFTATEMGLYAQDPDYGEILYMVMVDAKPDFIPDQSNVIMQRIGIGISFSNAQTVEVNFAGSGFITPADAKNMVNNALREHRLKKPLDHPDQSVETKHLKDGAVTTTKLKDRAVTDTKLAVSAATDTIIGKRTIDDTFSSFADSNTLGSHLSSLGSQVKAITGETKWSARPILSIRKINEELGSLKSNKLDANMIGRSAGKIPTLNSQGKWDESLLPPMDYIPMSKIGTSYGDIATLGYGGRFDKSRLPADVMYGLPSGLVYTRDFHTSSGADGYTKNPSGIIFQWGYVSLSSVKVSKTKTCYFPITFPSSCYNISVTEYGPDSVYSNKDDWYLHVTSFSRSSFTVVVASATKDEFVDTRNAYCYYFAVGK